MPKFFKASAGRKMAKQPTLVSVQRSVYKKYPFHTHSCIPFFTEDFFLCGVINYFPGGLQYGTTVGTVNILH
jgi:hypothetical protein